MVLGPVEMIMLAAIIAALALAVGWGLVRGPRDRDVELWARSYGVALTPSNRPLVERYVRRSTAFRRTGFVLGLLVVPPVLDAAGFDLGGFGLVLGTVGYAVGIVLAEVRLPRPRASRAAAGLDVRRVDLYLPTHLVWLPRVLTVVIVATGVWSLASPTDAAPGELMAGISDGNIVAAMIAALVTLLGVEVLQRAVIHRAQAVDDAAVRAADDALRSQSLHALAGAALAIDGGLLFVTLVRAADASDVGVLVGLAMLAPTVGFLACLWFANRAWRVRRQPLQPAGA